MWQAVSRPARLTLTSPVIRLRIALEDRERAVTDQMSKDEFDALVKQAGLASCGFIMGRVTLGGE